jgi:hypothetical protein
MRHLRMLGLMLIAALSLGAFAVATASATEPGVLPLEKAEVKVTFEKSVGKTVLEDAAATKKIECTSLDETKGAAGAATHVTLFNEVVLVFLECKQGALNCRSENLKAEKDAIGTILVLADFQIINVLNKSALEPGFAIILLDQNTKAIGTVTVLCGTSIIEVKGVVKGHVKTTSLSADIEAGKYLFGSPESKCDTSDVLCETLVKDPFLVKFEKVFGAAVLVAEVPFKVSPMVLFDD